VGESHTCAYRKPEAIGAEVGMMMRLKESPEPPPPGKVPPGASPSLPLLGPLNHEPDRCYDEIRLIGFDIMVTAGGEDVGVSGSSLTKFSAPLGQIRSTSPNGKLTTLGGCAKVPSW
jgi:hypothetical protein